MAKTLKKKKNVQTAKMTNGKLHPTDLDSRLSVYLKYWDSIKGEEDELQTRLATVQANLTQMELSTLPELMLEFGTTEIVATTGHKVKIDKVLTASVANRNEKEANRIFKRTKIGNLAEIKVNFSFTAKEKEMLKQVLEFSKKNKIPCVRSTSIHAATLKVAVREALDDGRLQPADLSPLGVFMVKKAVIKPPKSDD